MTTTFWKAHGTGNDFVIVDRPEPLTPGQVRWLCHRRFGIGGDGTLQALRAGDVAGWDGDPELWFMDYRNADGTVDWQDGAIATRHILAPIVGAADVPHDVIAHIPFNIVSQ
ncbi:MAG: hypothetical protein E7K76_12620, partial [Cutibacterium avidum]|nr:hypothetical protein [Cutibacterium avidum]